MYSSHSLGVSAYLNGIREDLDGFIEETRKILEFLGNKQKR